jgi:outer membrane protein assembly factor BamB
MLHVLDAGAFEPVLQTKLPAPAVGTLWGVGSMLLVETRDHQLLCFDVGAKPKLQWTLPWDESGVAGPPDVVRGRLVIPDRDGTVVGLDPATGSGAVRQSVGQPLSGSVISVDGHAVVTSIDGSLYRVDPVLESKKPAQ